MKYVAYICFLFSELFPVLLKIYNCKTCNGAAGATQAALIIAPFNAVMEAYSHFVGGQLGGKPFTHGVGGGMKPSIAPYQKIPGWPSK